MVSRVKIKSTKPKARAPKTRRSSQLIPQEVRFAAILAYLRKHGSTNTGPMAEELGWHYETARRFANLLVDIGQLHRTLQSKGHGRAEHFFHLGAAPVGNAVEVDDDVDHYPPVRPRASAYPLHHARDLWACAMFPVPAVLLEQHA